ncbi:MAG: cytochrome c peroxidase [Bermanella sp.]
MNTAAQPQPITEVCMVFNSLLQIRPKPLIFGILSCMALSACIEFPQEVAEESPNQDDSEQQADTNNDATPNNDDNDTISASERSLTLPGSYFNYANIALPDHFLVNNYPDSMPFQKAVIEYDNTPASNPTTDAGATLGRVLFYDTKLSANDTISCGSCHIQSFAFSDPNRLSPGFDGGHTRRRSIGLTNGRFYESGKFFWDERAASLEEQVLLPIQDSVEMGMDLTTLVGLLSAQDHYPELFTDAFGDGQVTSERIALALAQFVRSIISTTSPYDIGRAQVDSPLDDFPNFSNRENQGKRIFNTPGDNLPSCAGCHQSEAFVGANPATNNGLDRRSVEDLGVAESSGQETDEGKFKTPSLRNVALRPPFMHDGRFRDLDDVIDFYSRDIEDHDNLNPFLRDDRGRPINYRFNRDEQRALEDFLHTLTDTQMINDEKYSDPFK